MSSTSARATTLCALALGFCGPLGALSARAQSALVNFLDSPVGTDMFGVACAGVGDLTGDGLGDVVVGDPLHAISPGIRPGAVRVYNGKTGALLYSINGLVDGDQFGFSIAGLGDIDGDGRADFVVGSNGSDLMALSSGSARVFSGATGAHLFTVTGDSIHAALGTSLAGPGDCDGDQVPDLLVGVPGEMVLGQRRGGARLYSGATGALIRSFYGDALNDDFGRCVAAAGDRDQDGFAEIWVGANKPYPAGIGYARLLDSRDGQVLMTITSSIPDERFASCIAGGRDIDGDGVTDVLIGSTHTQGPGSVGVLRAFSGQSGSLLRAYYGQDFANCGTGTCFVGDINNDGVSEFLVSEISYNSQQMTSVQVISGATLNRLFTLNSTPVYIGLGYSVSAVGDTNGDGVPDLLASSIQGPAPATQMGFARSFSGFDNPPTIYCQPKVNSLGCQPRIDFSGVPSLSGDDNFHLRAVGELNRRNGLLIWGSSPAALPFGGGHLCVSPQSPIQRAMMHGSGGSTLPTQDCSGGYDAFFSHALIQSKALVPGATVYAQFFSRDPGFPAPQNIALTDAVEFTIAP
jgi:hypothetical protein